MKSKPINFIHDDRASLAKICGYLLIRPADDNLPLGRRPALSVSSTGWLPFGELIAAHRRRGRWKSIDSFGLVGFVVFCHD